MSTAKPKTPTATRPPGAAEPPAIGTGEISGDPDYMMSLARGLAVIRAFNEGQTRLTVADVARATGISRAATRRCLYTLSVLGYARSSDGTYELTPAILALGQTYLGQASIARVAQPVLERTSEQLHESCSLAVLDGDEIVYIARAARRRILSVNLSVGSRLPAACTSMGRVLLAFSDDASRTRLLGRIRLVRHTDHTIVDKTALAEELGRVVGQGFSLVDQELEVGLRSLAVPVRRAGTVVAAVNVGVHVSRGDRQTMQREILPVLRRAAEEIGASLAPTV
jgi:IclR family pca regulon transcriptional regulator